MRSCLGDVGSSPLARSPRDLQARWPARVLTSTSHAGDGFVSPRIEKSGGRLRTASFDPRDARMRSAKGAGATRRRPCGARPSGAAVVAAGVGYAGSRGERRWPQRHRPVWSAAKDDARAGRRTRLASRRELVWPTIDAQPRTEHGRASTDAIRRASVPPRVGDTGRRRACAPRRAGGRAQSGAG
jgi:hypothetical protein